MKKLSFAIIVFLSAMFPSRLGFAEGALAVGVPRDVAKQGFAYAFAIDKASPEEATKSALQTCREPSSVKSAQARALCTLVSTFHDQCVSIAEDPQAGTPGIGWAILPTRQAADKQALDNCRATAGAARKAFCKVDHSACDGSAK